MSVFVKARTQREAIARAQEETPDEREKRLALAAHELKVVDAEKAWRELDPKRFAELVQNPIDITQFIRDVIARDGRTDARVEIVSAKNAKTTAMRLAMQAAAPPVVVVPAAPPKARVSSFSSARNDGATKQHDKVGRRSRQA